MVSIKTVLIEALISTLSICGSIVLGKFISLENDLKEVKSRIGNLNKNVVELKEKYEDFKKKSEKSSNYSRELDGNFIEIENNVESLKSKFENRINVGAAAARSGVEAVSMVSKYCFGQGVLKDLEMCLCDLGCVVEDISGVIDGLKGTKK